MEHSDLSERRRTDIFVVWAWLLHVCGTSILVPIIEKNWPIFHFRSFAAACGCAMELTVLGSESGSLARSLAMGAMLLGACTSRIPLIEGTLILLSALLIVGTFIARYRELGRSATDNPR